MTYISEHARTHAFGLELLGRIYYGDQRFNCRRKQQPQQPRMHICPSTGDDGHARDAWCTAFHAVYAVQVLQRTSQCRRREGLSGGPQVQERVAYCRICLIAPNFPKMSYISSELMLKGKLRTYKHLQGTVTFKAFFTGTLSTVIAGWHVLQYDWKCEGVTDPVAQRRLL